MICVKILLYQNVFLVVLLKHSFYKQQIGNKREGDGEKEGEREKKESGGGLVWVKSEFLYISTRVWVLHTPNAGRNSHFQCLSDQTIPWYVFRCKYKKLIFLLNFLTYSAFCANNVKRAYFNQHLECAGPKRWLKGLNIQHHKLSTERFILFQFCSFTWHFHLVLLRGQKSNIK